MKPAIEVKGVWKQYRKGVDRRYKSLRDTLAGLPSLLRGEDEETFWALQDISFDVEPGESIGIIGKNGAGKSTLLKILSRITPPTKGEIILRGRVASLLEVGTGFHPELTGRENIFFNGSILGMKYAEIRSRFDEIVDFSGVETFLDTPLKHYSSGMQMRLAFSVAAHLDAEILLIDEVLAVGDSEFQKKCIGKMDEVSKGEGKSIIFVSHNLNLLASLCKFSVLLYNGKSEKKTCSRDLVTMYLESLHSIEMNLKINIYHNANNVVKVNSVNSIDSFGLDKKVFYRDEPIGISIKYNVNNNTNVIRCGINIYDMNGVNIFDSHNNDSAYYMLPHPNGNFEMIAWIPASLLKTGDYLVGFGFFNHQIHAVFARGINVITFKISENKDNSNFYLDELPGIINPIIKWQEKKN